MNRLIVHHVNLLNGSADLRSHPNHVGPHLSILGARIISQIDSHRPGEKDSGQHDGYRKDSAEYLPPRSFRIHFWLSHRFLPFWIFLDAICRIATLTVA
jgi:hypothetical protein